MKTEFVNRHLGATIMGGAGLGIGAGEVILGKANPLQGIALVGIGIGIGALDDRLEKRREKRKEKKLELIRKEFEEIISRKK